MRLLFGKDVKDVDVDMVVKKRNEFMADRGKKVYTVFSLKGYYCSQYTCGCGYSTTVHKFHATSHMKLIRSIYSMCQKRLAYLECR